MAGIKISELTAATAKTGTELIPIIQGGANKSITANVLFSGLYDIANGNIKVTPVATVGFTAIVATESASAGNVNGVNYVYLATFITATGETIPLAASNAISVTNKQVDLTNLPVSPDSRVTGRRIYRQVSGTGAHLAKLVATIANNTATT
jgi:hypothetical protein